MGAGVEVGRRDRPCKRVQLPAPPTPPQAPTQTSMKADPQKTLHAGPAHADGSVSHPQCAGEEDWVDSRTVYVGHREPPPGAEAYIPQRYPDNRIVSAKVSIRLGLPPRLLGPSELPKLGPPAPEWPGCTLITKPPVTLQMLLGRHSTSSSLRF